METTNEKSNSEYIKKIKKLKTYLTNYENELYLEVFPQRTERL